jgi:hypothetical protein
MEILGLLFLGLFLFGFVSEWNSDAGSEEHVAECEDNFDELDPLYHEMMDDVNDFK